MFFCTIIQLYYCTFDIERSRAYASPALFRRLSQGSLPTWAGSPLVGRDLHPLDDTQSFMKASPPPIPFDQQSLVALNYLSIQQLIDDAGVKRVPLPPRSPNLNAYAERWVRSVK